MKKGDVVKPKNGDGLSGKVIFDNKKDGSIGIETMSLKGKDKNKIIVEFENGKRKLYTKSKLKKYYTVINNEK